MHWDKRMNQKIKVALVQPPVDKRFDNLDMTFKRLAPPLGLSILACETERRFCDNVAGSNIKVYCPVQITDNLVASWAECDILGISTWFSNYENGLEIARIAKKINPELLVVFGGINATNLGQRILLNRSEVDLVVTGDGEDTLWRILAGHDYSSVPNLWYRKKDNTPAFTSTQLIDLDSIDIWDFRHGINMQLEEYDSRRPDYKFNPNLPPIGLSMTRGCKKADNQCKRCDYCSIPYKNLRLANPEIAWKQIQHLHNLYGIESFFETGDDFGLLDYASELNTIKPKLPLRFRIYASPWLLTEKCIEALSLLGVYEIFLGLETVDKIISRNVGHPSSKKNVIKTLERLKRAGISVCLPFLLGLPGETTESVRFRIIFAKELVERYSNIRMVLISLAIPLMGSSWFERLSSNEMIRKEYGKFGVNLATDDVFDYHHLLELSLQHESAVSMKELIDSLEIMRKQLEKHVIVGCFGGIESLF